MNITNLQILIDYNSWNYKTIRYMLRSYPQSGYIDEMKSLLKYVLDERV